MENFIENLLEFCDKMLQKTSQMEAILNLISQDRVFDGNQACRIGEILTEMLNEIQSCIKDMHHIFTTMAKKEV